MGDAVADGRVLISSRSWSATPWNYSSMRYLQFREDGSAELIHGLGQTIHAKIRCRWVLPEAGKIRLTYEQSPPCGRFHAYAPEEQNRVRELAYTLTYAEVSGVESIVARPYLFLWTLELSEQPWPPELRLPHEVPRVFYGHRQEGGAREPGLRPSSRDAAPG